jgi:hypothetical protein
MLSLPADLFTVLRMVTRAWLEPTLRESSLTGLSKDCPAKVVEAQAVAAAIATSETTIDYTKTLQMRAKPNNDNIEVEKVI